MSRKRQQRRQVPGVGLLDPASAQALMRQRFDSREWWRFLSASLNATRFLAELEQRFYSGPRNKHFELLMIPALPVGLGLVAVAFARKRLVTTRQLAAFYDAHDMPHQAEQLAQGGRDVFLLADNERIALRMGTFVERLLYGQPVDLTSPSGDQP